MKENKLKLVTKVLAIIIICLISFAGVYVQKYNKMEDIVKGYTLSKDLEGYRQIILEISEDSEEESSEETEESEEESSDETEETSDEAEESEESSEETEEGTEESENSEEESEDDLIENYELAKSVIEDRLEAMNSLSGYTELSDIDTTDYNISLDKKTGKIYLQIPENNSTDYVVSNIVETATIEIADSEDGTVYLDNSHFKSASVVYSTTTSGTVVYLEIEFNKEGAEILKDISENEYATISEEEESEEEEESSDEESEDTETTDEETETSSDDTENEEETSSEEETETDETEEESEEEEEEVTQKEITLSISGSEIVTTSFDDPLTNGTLDLSMNSATTDTEELEEYFESATTIALLLNSGYLPYTYEVTENQYVDTDISMTTVQNVLVIVAVIFVILLAYMVIRKKVRGLLSAISFIGFTALYLLLIRYTNVVISIESIIAAILVLGIDYAISIKLLNVSVDNKKLYNKEYLQIITKLIPAFAISIIFTLTSWTTLNSFGMMMFWGIFLMVIYNILITRNIVNQSRQEG